MVMILLMNLCHKWYQRMRILFTMMIMMPYGEALEEDMDEV